jgi:hypothetical protein
MRSPDGVTILTIPGYGSIELSDWRDDELYDAPPRTWRTRIKDRLRTLRWYLGAPLRCLRRR